MTTYHRSVVVDAPIERVWAFHSTIDGLRALTPGPLGLQVLAIRGDERGTLVQGSEIDLQMRPLGVLPTTGWTSIITDREVSAERCRFTDVMRGGPFDHWRHEHTFEMEDGRTHVHDRVSLRLGGPLAGVISPFTVFGLSPMFWYRHRRTRAELE